MDDNKKLDAYYEKKFSCKEDDGKELPYGPSTIEWTDGMMYYKDDSDVDSNEEYYSDQDGGEAPIYYNREEGEFKLL